MGIKEAKVLEVGDVIEVEGNFLEIKRTDYENCVNKKKCKRYFLKVILKKEKMDKLKDFLKKK